MSDSRPDIVIHPEPTDEELVAIVAVLDVIESADDPVATARQPSRWTDTARRELMRGFVEREYA